MKDLINIFYIINYTYMNIWNNIVRLFNKWANDGERNIQNLLPKPLDVDFKNRC